MSDSFSTKQFSAAAKTDCLKLIEMALTEDIGASDLDAGVDCTTDSIVPKHAAARAAFVSRADGAVSYTHLTLPTIHLV